MGTGLQEAQGGYSFTEENPKVETSTDAPEARERPLSPKTGSQVISSKAQKDEQSMKQDDPRAWNPTKSL